MSTKTIKLTEETIERCQRQALGQFLTSWSYDSDNGDEVELSYDEVLGILRDEENYDMVVDWRITVWEAFDIRSGEDIAQYIEDLYKSFSELATEAVRAEREVTINMIGSSLSNPALGSLPAPMAFQVLMGIIQTKDKEF